MYHDLKVDPAPVLEGAAVAAGLLLAEHIGLWHLRGARFPLPARYTLGTLALLAGFAHTCHRRGDLRPAAEFAAIAVCGGGLVAAAHLIRHAAWKRQEGRRLAVYREQGALSA